MPLFVNGGLITVNNVADFIMCIIFTLIAYMLTLPIIIIRLDAQDYYLATSNTC